MKASEILQAMYILLLEPSAWRAPTNKIDKAWAGYGWNSNAIPCDPLSSQAKSWTTEGAAIRVSESPRGFESIKSHLLAFSPRLGVDGAKVEHSQLLTLILGAKVHAQLVEIMRKEEK